MYKFLHLTLEYTSYIIFVNGLEILYRKNCGKCHTLYEPADFTLKVWKKNLKEMRIKAGLKDEEYKKILAYLSEYCIK